MAIEEFNTVNREACGEFVEKKSRFIGTLRPVSSEEEANAFILEMKKKYWDARHNCSAFTVLSENGKIIEKCNDDGEPSRTAGSPMLEVLKGAGLLNVALVVTRYFGGILLGTGGLVRAYSAAASEAVGSSEIIMMKLMNRVVVKTDYAGYGRLQYFASNDGFTVAETNFTNMVEAVVLCDDTGLASLTKKMVDATAGKCIIEKTGKDFCALGTKSYV